MNRLALCLTSPGGKLDSALQQGLTESGCELKVTENLSEALQLLRLRFEGHSQSSAGTHVASDSPTYSQAIPIVLAASIRAGAIPLLTLMHEQGVPLPWTLIYDEDGNDVHTIIKALQLGAREYVLASDPEVQRRLNARLLAERANAHTMGEPVTAQSSHPHFPTSFAQPPTHATTSVMEWDPIGRVIHVGEKYVRLSSVESRIFDKLLANRTHTVELEDLVSDVLKRSNMDHSIGARRLRPHVMRLRRKLERFTATGMRIVNMRGTGYMLI